MSDQDIQLPEPMGALMPGQWDGMGISRKEFVERWRTRLERDEHSPAIGTLAPDFELEIMDGHGTRTGETFQLSSVRGKPVGLIFGSYT